MSATTRTSTDVTETSEEVPPTPTPEPTYVTYSEPRLAMLQDHAEAVANSRGGSSSSSVDFASAPDLTRELENIIYVTAKTGAQSYPWELYKVILGQKMAAVLDKFNSEVDDCGGKKGDTFDDRKTELLELLDEFDETPFTIQRLCELLVEPRRMYNSTKRFMNAVFKMVTVSIVTPGGDPLVLEELAPYAENVQPSAGNVLNASDEGEANAVFKDGGGSGDVKDMDLG